jgi:hypothetical protein
VLIPPVIGEPLAEAGARHLPAQLSPEAATRFARACRYSAFGQQHGRLRTIGSAATCRRRQMRRLFLAHVGIELCDISPSWRS